MAKHYGLEFKTMIVNLMTSGQSVKQVSSDYTLSQGIIRRWRQEFDGSKEAFTGKGNIASTSEQREVATLKAELIYRDKYHTFLQAYHAIYNMLKIGTTLKEYILL